jgi:hypothetical protein
MGQPHAATHHPASVQLKPKNDWMVQQRHAYSTPSILVSYQSTQTMGQPQAATQQVFLVTIHGE